MELQKDVPSELELPDRVAGEREPSDGLEVTSRHLSPDVETALKCMQRFTEYEQGLSAMKRAVPIPENTSGRFEVVSSLESRKTNQTLRHISFHLNFCVELKETDNAYVREKFLVKKELIRNQLV